MTRQVLVVEAEGGLLEELRARLEREGLKVEVEDGENSRRFVKDLAHELSTPLTPLAGYLRILESGKLGALSPQQRRVVDAMLSSLARLTRIVENLSDFATLAAGDARLHQAPFDPDRLAQEVVAEQEAAIRDARLNVRVSPAGGGPVVADARKLRQALGNLLSNAVKFCRPGEGRVEIRLAVAKGFVRVDVQDNGPGISPADHHTIFERFRQVGDTLTGKPEGTGLGLPISRRIVEHFGGRLRVESELGKGATFSFILPLGASSGAGEKLGTSAMQTTS